MGFSAPAFIFLSLKSSALKIINGIMLFVYDIFQEARKRGITSISGFKTLTKSQYLLNMHECEPSRSAQTACRGENRAFLTLL